MCRPFGQKLYTLDFLRKEKKIFHTQMQAPSGLTCREDEIFLKKARSSCLRSTTGRLSKRIQASASLSSPGPRHAFG